MTEITNAITTALNILKSLRNANETIKNAEFAKMFADLEFQLAEMKIQVADLLMQNAELRTQIQSKAENQAAVADLVLRDDYYYASDGDGPFCMTCVEQSQKKVRLVNNQSRVAIAVGRYYCPTCDRHYR